MNSYTMTAKEYRNQLKSGKLQVDKKGRVKKGEMTPEWEAHLDKKRVKAKGNHTFIIENAPFMSVNEYNNLYWSKKKKFKDELRAAVDETTGNKSFMGGYNLEFKFFFAKKVYDTINVGAMIKIIEDRLFKQDNKNGWIKTQNFKSKNKTNYIEIKITRI